MTTPESTKSCRKFCTPGSSTAMGIGLPLGWTRAALAGGGLLEFGCRVVDLYGCARLQRLQRFESSRDNHVAFVNAVCDFDIRHSGDSGADGHKLGFAV